MTKSELKDGMICKMGELYYVKVGNILMNHTTRFVRLNNYNEDLTHMDEYMQNWNIDGVYKTDKYFNSLECLNHGLSLIPIWKRVK